MTLETRVSISEAEQLVKKAFLKNGVKEDVAASVSTALVAAEAEGQVGHGFSRVKDYVAQVKTKKINVDANLNASYTFENFIEGECNRLARSAGYAVASKPGGTSFNPLLRFSVTHIWSMRSPLFGVSLKPLLL
mgnify:CR=1 FL=1